MFSEEQCDGGHGEISSLPDGGNNNIARERTDNLDGGRICEYQNQPPAKRNCCRYCVNWCDEDIPKTYNACCLVCFRPSRRLSRYTCGVIDMVHVAGITVLMFFTAIHLTTCDFISIPAMTALGIVFVMICLCQCVLKFKVIIRKLHCQTYSLSLMNCLFSVACILAVLFVTAVGVDSVNYYHTNITATYPACIYTCGIAGLILVAATITLIVGTALGPVYCTNANIPTFIALGLILLIIIVCSCFTRIFERRYYSRGDLMPLFYIICFLSVLFIIAVVIDSIYIFKGDLSGPQSITGVCNEYGATVYIALSYFYALIVFVFCGCIWSYCIDLIKTNCCTVGSYNYSNYYGIDDSLSI